MLMFVFRYTSLCPRHRSNLHASRAVGTSENWRGGTVCWNRTRTFPGNQDATLKLVYELTFIKILLVFEVPYWPRVKRMPGKGTPHCWGHHVQKVNTEAKFYFIWFVMVNALIWYNFEKKWLGSFWDNPIYLIRYPHGQDLRFFWKVKRCSFYSYPTLLYCVMAVFPLQGVL